MPEIGSYSQANIRGPVVRKIILEIKVLLIKQHKPDPLKGIEIQ